MKRRSGGHDPVLTGAALALTGMGLVFIYSAGFARAIGDDASLVPNEFRTQVVLGALGIGLAAAVSSLPVAFWRRWSGAIGWASFAGLVAVYVAGTTLNGAKRWVVIGPISLQPAEFAKLAIILVLARLLAARVPWRAPKVRNGRDWRLRVLVPKLDRAAPLVVILAFAGLVELEKDLGTAAVILAIGIGMLFLVGVSRPSFLALLALVVVVPAALIVKEPYRLERLLSNSSRWDLDKVNEEGFQTTQSELAMASGGAWGVGLGNGSAKYKMPAATTDYILATVAEERGVFGPLAALLGIGVLVARLWALARRATDRFASLTLAGIAIWLAIQAATNMMMANATFPSIGIPFPFLSSGGSSLLALWLAVGIARAMTTAAKEPAIAAREEGDENRRHRWGNGRARLSGA